LARISLMARFWRSFCLNNAQNRVILAAMWLCIYILWLAKEPSLSNWQQSSIRKEMSCLFVMYTSIL
jgi:hypothetical protein